MKWGCRKCCPAAGCCPGANWKGHREQFLLPFFFPSLLANTKPSPGRGQPRISALMQMLPLLNQERGLTLMYLATTGAGKMFRTGISFSLLPLKIYWGKHIRPDGETFGQKNVKRERERKIWWIYCHSAEIWRADDNKSTVNSVTWTGLNVKTSDLAGDSELKTGNRSLISWLGPHNLHTNTFSPVECHWSLRGLAANFSTHGASNLHLLAF